MELPDRSQAKSWEGKDVVDRDGQRLGRCVGVFADTATGMPEWLHIDVEGHVRSFVPALEAAESDGTVRVRFARETVLAAPAVGDDEQLSKAEEIELYRHYGIPVESGEGSVLPSSDASAGSSTTAPTAAAPAPVVGTSDRTSTAAASSSGADTSVAEADVDGRTDARTGDTTALTPTTTSGATEDDAGTSALSDAGTVSGGAVTPETGEHLPVLDPAAASTPVPEEQVSYVDEPEAFTDAGPSDAATEAAPAAPPPAAEQPRPALRPVPPASPPPAAAAPSSNGGGLSALTPLGAVAGVAAA
ncbi:MAG: PRC-barrel domain-containing protein, partial [Actinomycetota bacterium]|nr:PRC-barrel domain-containing protein [Actinomycetota bacterium]